MHSADERTQHLINIYACVIAGKTPVRVFFHVDYKVLSEDGKDLSRQLSKDDVPSLQSELQSIERKIKEISLEIDHAKRQEAFLNEANGKTINFRRLRLLYVH